MVDDEAVPNEDQKPDIISLIREQEHLLKESFQPIPAVFLPSQQRGRDIAVYIFPNNHELCYEWHYQLALSDNCTLTYTCCGCKALKTREREKYPRPVASCRIVNGFFTTDPLNPVRPHFCEPRSTSRTTARRLIIERRSELRDSATGNQRPASVELQELSSRISSENLASVVLLFAQFVDRQTQRGNLCKKHIVDLLRIQGGFSADERLAVIEQITCSSENVRHNARRMIQRAQQRARQKDVRRHRRKRFRCSLCASSRDFPCGRRPPFNPHHTAVLLAALMRYRQLSVDCAKEVYQTCLQKRKMLCKEHFVEAATSLITEIKTATTALPGNDIDLNALYMSEGMISPELVKHLNTESGRFDSKEWITARSVAFFLNDTMAYCVDRNVANEVNGCHLSLDESGNVEEEECNLQATDLLDKRKPKEEAEQGQKIMEILRNLSEERCSGVVKQEPYDEIGTGIGVPTHPLILSQHSLRGSSKETIGKLETCDAHEEELMDQSPGSSLSSSQSSLSARERMEDSFEDQLFVVEGRKLLELFRYCPICGTDMDASGGSFRLTAVGKAPVVDLFCLRCLKEKGKKTRWEGCSGDRKSMEQK
ncbi:hypothetical protein RB195_008918 [Necator americanus]|uniref:Uncharacterized protein n=1 Tax=Necator americanus TaxID=51031 RepID=A0ABR1CQY3_NECAM